MYIMTVNLYGSFQTRELARNLVLNLKEVKREERADHPWEMRIVLSYPIKESSLIPLLRQSGIQGFRLGEIHGYRFSRKGSPLSL